MHRKTLRESSRLALILTFITALALGQAGAITLAQIDNDIDAIINNANPNVQWSVLIENEWGTQTYYSLNSTTPRRPASNTKIFTTAAAIGTLGPTYVWRGFQLQSSSTSSPVESVLSSSNNSLADELYGIAGGSSSIINWCSGVGIDMTGAQMFDGSGLSWSNRFTSRQTLDLVRYMMDNYTYGQWATHLAISCTKGTLGSRLCGTGKTGRVHAKTGTLTNGQTLSLSGYIDNINDGERYFFSIYCNSVPSSSQSNTRSRIDSIVSVMTQNAIPNPGPPVGGTIVDNNDSGFSTTGAWGTSSGSGFYGTNSLWASTGGASATATWSTTLAPGNYDVYAWWVNGSNRASNAPYQVNHLNGSSTVTANQTTNGGQWNLLGNYAFDGSSSVVLSDSANNNVVSADAVRFVFTSGLEYIADNADSGFSASSNWVTSSSTPGYYGSNYAFRLTQSTSDAASWSVNLPATGSYQVFARWTAGSNRATSAPYIVTHAGGSTTVPLNQQQNNNTWVSLGTYTFNSGTSTRVLLSCWTSSGTVVIADAIKLVPQ